MGIDTNKLRIFFREKKITQKEIAEVLGVTPAYISAIFTGKTDVGKKVADQMQKEFGISAAWLLTGEGNIKSSAIGSNNAIGAEASVVVNEKGTFDAHLEVIKKQQEQIDRLLNIIEDLSRKIK